MVDESPELRSPLSSESMDLDVNVNVNVIGNVIVCAIVDSVCNCCCSVQDIKDLCGTIIRNRGKSTVAAIASLSPSPTSLPEKQQKYSIAAWVANGDNGVPLATIIQMVIALIMMLLPNIALFNSRSVLYVYNVAAKSSTATESFASISQQLRILQFLSMTLRKKNPESAVPSSHSYYDDDDYYYFHLYCSEKL